MKPQVLVNVADLKDPDDPQGRSYRQVNAAMKHSYKIGSLVEINHEGSDANGVRLFIVHHGRDCDQTPLYGLYHEPTLLGKQDWEIARLLHGFSEDSLTLIREPK